MTAHAKGMVDGTCWASPKTNSLYGPIMYAWH